MDMLAKKKKHAKNLVITGNKIQHVPIFTMKDARAGKRTRAEVCEEHNVLTVLVHGVRFRLLLADVSEGAYDGDAIGQLLVVLVVVLFQQGLADPLPGILTQRT